MGEIIKKFAVLFLITVMLLGLVSCGGTDKELIERAKGVLFETDAARSYVADFHIEEKYILISVPYHMPERYQKQVDSMTQRLNSADISAFELTDTEIGHVAGKFVVNDGDNLCKIEVGCEVSSEDFSKNLLEAQEYPETMILRFTFADTGESVAVAGAWQKDIYDVAAELDQRGGSTTMSAWMMQSFQEGKSENDWLEVSGKVFKIAELTLYEKGEPADEPEQLNIYYSAVVAGVIESVEQYIKPVSEPVGFSVDREAAFLYDDGGPYEFVLENGFLKTENAYYPLKDIDDDGLELLHRVFGYSK